MDAVMNAVPLVGRRGSADSDQGATPAEADRNLGPKEVLEKRRQKKRRDTAMRHFRHHRSLYESQEEAKMRAEITYARANPCRPACCAAAAWRPATHRRGALHRGC